MSPHRSSQCEPDPWAPVRPGSGSCTPLPGALQVLVAGDSPITAPVQARCSSAETTPGPFHRALSCCDQTLHTRAPSEPSRERGGHLAPCTVRGAATCRAWSAVRAGGSLPRPLPRQPKGSLSSGFIPLRTAVCHPRCPLNPLLIHSCVSEGVAPRLRRPPPKNEQRRPARPEALIVARSLVGAKELDTSFLKDFNLKTQKQQDFISILSYEKMEWCLSGHQDFRNAQNGGPTNAWDQ